jgi:hypothetical protein
MPSKASDAVTARVEAPHEKGLSGASLWSADQAIMLSTNQARCSWAARWRS